MSHDFLAGLPFHPERKIRPSTVLGAFRIPLEPADREFGAFPNTALYGFVGYAPQAAAIAVGRLFTSSVLLLFYLGRLGNLAVAALLLALAVRATPFFRPVFFLIGLLPMAVFQTSSLSADGVTNGLAFLLTAFALRCAFGAKATAGASDVAILALLSLLLALTKPGYLLLAGLVLLIPRSRFGSTMRGTAARSLVLLAAAGTGGLWAAALRARDVLGAPSAGGLGAVRADPAGFLLDMLMDHLRRAPVLAVQFLGKLGWADVSLPLLLVALHGLALLAVALTCGRAAPALQVRDRAILAAIVVGTVFLVAAPFYVSVIAPGPEGAAAHHPQGRYLLPLGPTGLLLLCNRRWTLDWDGRWRWLCAWTALVLAAAVAAVGIRYYF